MTRFFTLTAAALTLSATAVFADGHSGMVKTSAEGYLTDGHDMTLYTFDNDAAGKSNCYGKCAKAWPPLLVQTGTKLSEGFSTVKRKNGDLQLAYGDQPLYLWVKDKKPGDITGDGVKGVWHIARP